MHLHQRPAVSGHSGESDRSRYHFYVCHPVCHVFNRKPDIPNIHSNELLLTFNQQLVIPVV